LKGFLRTAVLIVASFAMGVAVTRYYDAHRPAAKPAEAPPVANVKPLDLEHEPLWAYGFDKPAEPGETAKPQAPPNRNLRPNEDPVEQTRLRSLKGSKAKYSLVDVRDGQNVIDWFPADHSAMPDVIKHGPATLGEKKRGCGSCHLPNGKGRPENAGVAGLPSPYILRQLQDFRSGKRHSADPRKPNTNTMIDLAKALSDDELQQVADYFSSLSWTQWIRVVETDTVPKTRIVGNLFLPLEQARTEPIGSRLIEMPEDEEETETYRNPHVGFVAYVPPGSLARGKDLVTTGGARTIGTEFIPGKNTPCITCHREDLMGAVDSPPIVGRSPSYIARQLWDIQQGTRNGDAVQLMKITIAKLTPDDILAVAAYIASLPPPRKAASTSTAASH
jgi:cytochrome c553